MTKFFVMSLFVLTCGQAHAELRETNLTLADHPYAIQEVSAKLIDASVNAEQPCRSEANLLVTATYQLYGSIQQIVTDFKFKKEESSVDVAKWAVKFIPLWSISQQVNGAIVGPVRGVLQFTIPLSQICRVGTEQNHHEWYFEFLSRNPNKPQVRVVFDAQEGWTSAL
jgi:hypothetical protein